MYQTGGTIKETIEFVQRHEYVLPAIQREFVWKPEQIERLFDSLMQGYPFGTFLLWRVQAENSADYKFYDFVRDYHQRDNPHCPALPTQTDRVTAVLGWSAATNGAEHRPVRVDGGQAALQVVEQPRRISHYDISTWTCSARLSRAKRATGIASSS